MVAAHEHREDDDIHWVTRSVNWTPNDGSFFSFVFGCLFQPCTVTNYAWNCRAPPRAVLGS